MYLEKLQLVLYVIVTFINSAEETSFPVESRTLCVRPVVKNMVKVMESQSNLRTTTQISISSSLVRVGMN